MKPLSPKVWFERIERSKKLQKCVRDEAKSFLRGYQGDYSLKGRKNRLAFRDEMNVNAIYAMVELITPSIYSGNPRIIATAKQPIFERSAKMRQEVINYWLNELGAGEEYARCLFDSFFGYAAIETGWHYETRVFVTKKENQVILADGSTHINMEDVEEESVIRDQPFMKWRNPFDVILDPDVPRRKDGRFQIINDIVTYQYFLDMPDIDIKLKKMVKPTHRPEDRTDRESSSEREIQSDEEWVELNWIWCRETESRYLVTPQLKDKYILEQPWPYYMEYKDDPFPVTILDGKTDAESPYTFSEIRPLWDHIVERNRLRTSFNAHMKRSIPKYIYDKQTGTNRQIAKFFHSGIDQATELNKPDGLKVAPTAPMPPELYNWDKLLEEDFLNVSSLSEYRNQSLADTATEASIIEGRSAIRKGRRRREFEQFIVASSAKMGMLCEQFMDRAQAIKIEGPEGSQWVNLTKQEIQGEYSYDIEPGVMEPKNEALHRQQVLKYAEIMAQNPHTNQRVLAVEISKAFGLPAEKMLLPEKQVQDMQASSKEPITKIKDIDIKDIPVPEAQAKIVSKVMEDMGIDPNSVPPAPQMDQGAPPPDMGDNMPVEPVGGQLGLEPVDGQQMIQPASEMPPQF